MKSAGRGSISHIYKVHSVEPCMIAYIATLVSTVTRRLSSQLSVTTTRCATSCPLAPAGRKMTAPSKAASSSSAWSSSSTHATTRRTSGPRRLSHGGMRTYHHVLCIQSRSANLSLAGTSMAMRSATGTRARAALDGTSPTTRSSRSSVQLARRRALLLLHPRVPLRRSRPTRTLSPLRKSSP